MSEEAQARSYRDLVVGDGRLLGYPELCRLPTGGLLVSTYHGRCLVVDPDSGKTIPQPVIAEFIVPACLRSPTASTIEPVLCCAATRVMWTGLWELGASESLRIEAAGAVNAAALSPDGNLLALGLGGYPLGSPHSHRAVIELFSTSTPRRPLERRVLPGVAVDQLTFSSSGEELIAVTGALTQDRGHVVLLECPTLGILELGETDAAMCKAVMTEDGGFELTLVYRDVIERRNPSRPWELVCDRRFPEGLNAAAICPDREWIFLSDGRVIDFWLEDVGDLPPLPDCWALAVLDDGRVAGINHVGTLRLWELEP